MRLTSYREGAVMATEHGDRAVREAPLSIGKDEPPEDSTQPDEPEQYGLRVGWQSDEEKLEAAEFLLATRVQQDARLRAVHDLEILRRSAED